MSWRIGSSADASLYSGPRRHPCARSRSARPQPGNRIFEKLSGSLGSSHGKKRSLTRATSLTRLNIFDPVALVLRGLGTARAPLERRRCECGRGAGTGRASPHRYSAYPAPLHGSIADRSTADRRAILPPLKPDRYPTGTRSKPDRNPVGTQREPTGFHNSGENPCGAPSPPPRAPLRTCDAS